MALGEEGRRCDYELPSLSERQRQAMRDNEPGYERSKIDESSSSSLPSADNK
jgi:hypothetical protein